MPRAETFQRPTAAVLSVGAMMVALHTPAAFLLPLVRWCAEAFTLNP